MHKFIHTHVRARGSPGKSPPRCNGILYYSIGPDRQQGRPSQTACADRWPFMMRPTRSHACERAYELRATPESTSNPLPTPPPRTGAMSTSLNAPFSHSQHFHATAVSPFPPPRPPPSHGSPADSCGTPSASIAQPRRPTHTHPQCNGFGRYALGWGGVSFFPSVYHGRACLARSFSWLAKVHSSFVALMGVCRPLSGRWSHERLTYLYQDGVVLRSGCRQGSRYNQAAVVAAPVRHLPSALTSRGGKGGVRADRHPLPLTLSARPPAALRGSDAAMRTCGQMRRL